MGQIPDLQEARRRLGLALSALCHDRWTLGYIREGWVQPIAVSEISRRLLQGRPLLPMSRRALFEKRPLAINSVVEPQHPTNGYDWELDWPALLYAPVGAMGHRPIGLLTLGCRHDYWYTEEDIAYAHTLGITLAPLVTALREPLSRLNQSEGEVAQLLSYGLSAQEIARAIRTDDKHAARLVGSVRKKLEPLNADDLMFPIVQMRRRMPMTW